MYVQRKLNVSIYKLIDYYLFDRHELKNYKDMARPVLPKNTHSFKRTC